MSTLYITDLDATLLNTDAKISRFTADTINALMEKGMKFSFATARSDETALRVTEGLVPNVPIVVYTGAFLVDPKTREKIVSHFMNKREIDAVKEAVGIFRQIPIVYSVLEGREKFIYDLSIATDNMKKFVKSREKGTRNHPVGGGFESTLIGDIFYFAFIEPKEVLEPVYEFLRDKCNCLFQPDNYTDNWFLEVMAEKATKAKAALELKSMLGCDKMVAFGDGINDIPLLRAADEGYAVANAEDKLKEIATGIIGHCDEDAVAKWLTENSGY